MKGTAPESSQSSVFPSSPFLYDNHIPTVAKSSIPRRQQLQVICLSGHQQELNITNPWDNEAGPVEHTLALLST